MVSCIPRVGKRSGRSALAIGLLCGLCGLLGTVAAWGQPPENTTPENVPVSGLSEERYERMFVPEQDFARLFSLKTGVLLETADFLTLIDRAKQAEAAAEHPAGMIVEQVRCEVRFEKDVVRVTARCQISQSRPDWQTLPIPLARLNLLRARWGDHPAPLGRDPQTGELTLVDRFTGRRELLLEMTTPIQRVGTEELAEFSVFPQAAGVLRVQIPAQRVLQLNGAIVEAERSEYPARQVEMPMGGKATTQLRLTDAVGQALNESLVFARTEYGVSLETDAAAWQAQCHLSLFGKRFNELQFQVPTQLELTDVQAPGLQAWEMQDDPDRADHTRITLTFRETLPERIQVVLRGIQLLDNPADWRLAGLTLRGATSHTGGLVLASPPQMRVKTTAAVGIRPAVQVWRPAQAELLDRPRQFYDIWQEDFLLGLSIAPTEREVQAAVSHVLKIEEQETRLDSVLTLQTLFAPLFEVTLELPLEWRVERIAQQQAAVDWSPQPSAAGRQLIRLPLSPPVKPGEKRTVWVSLRLLREQATLGEKPQQFPLPDLKMAGVNILEGAYGIVGPERLDIVPQDIVGMDPAFLGLPQERFGYRYQDSVIGGQVQVSRKPARFNASTRQVIFCEEDQLTVQLLAELDISGGGLREVTVQLSPLPEIAAEFQAGAGVTIAEQRRSGNEQGQRWQLTFDRFVTGKVPLHVQLTLPGAAVDQRSIPLVLFPAADLQEQFLAFAAQTDQQLQVEVREASGRMLEPADPADLPLTPAQRAERIVAGYHLTQPGGSARLRTVRFAPQPIPTAIGQELQLSSLLLESGEFQQQVKLQLAAVGVQSLVIELPAEARLWSALLAGVPVTARKTDRGFVIPLAGNQLQGTTRELEILYGVPAGKLPLQTFAQFRLPAPRFSAVDGHGNLQPLELMQVEWRIHHPPEAQVQAVQPGVQVLEDQAADNWLLRLLRKWERISAELFLGNLMLAGFLCLACYFLARSVQWARPSRGNQARMVLLSGLCGMGFLVALCLYPGPRDQLPLGELNLGLSSPPGTTIAPAPESTAVDSGWELSTADPVREEFSAGDSPSSLQRQSTGESEKRMEKAKQDSSGFNPFGTAQPEMAEQQVQPEPLALPPAPVVMPQSDLGIVRNEGLLSLQLTLPVPDSLQTTRLRTSGMEAAGGLPIRYLSETAVQRLRLLLSSLVVLMFWLLRDSRWTSKVSCLLIVWGVPVVFLGIAPVLLLPILEGIFIGGLLGGVLWCLWGVGQCCGRCWRAGWCRWGSWRPVMKSAAGLLLLLGGTVELAAVQAQPGTPAVQQSNQRGPVQMTEQPPIEIAPPIAPPIAPAPKVRVVFPYADPQAPQAGARIFVPQEEYLRLWRAAHPDEQTEPAPLESQIHEANYVATFEPEQTAGAEEGGNRGRKGSIKLQARYVVQNYRDQPTRVKLPIAPLVVESLRMNARPVAGDLEPDRQPAVLLHSSGLQVVDAVFRLPADVFGAAGQFQVDFLPVASGTLTFVLPAPELQVLVNAGQVPFQLIEQEDSTRVELGISEGGSRTVNWQPKVSTSQLQFLSCESSREVWVKDHGLELQYVYDFQIAQGSFSEVEFELPAEVKLKSLTGNDLAGWQAIGENRLRVLLKQPVETRTRLTLQLYQPAAMTTEATLLNLPDVVPQGVTREIGTWGIGWDGALTVGFPEAEGVRQLQNREFPRLAATALLTNVQRVYRFTGRPQRIGLDVRRKQATTQAVHYTVVDIQPHKTHLATLAEIDVQGEPRLSVAFALPVEMQVVELTALGMEDWFVSAGPAEGPQQLTVLFGSPQQGKIQVVIRGHIQQAAREQEELLLQTPQLLQAERNVTYLGIGAAETFAVVVQAAAGWQHQDPQRLPNPLRQMAGFPLRLGFQSSAEIPQALQLTVRAEQAQLRGNSVTLLVVSDVSLDYGLSLQWTVTRAATDRFFLVTPGWLAERLEFQADEIRQVRQQPWGTDEVLWTFDTKRPISGQLVMTAVASLPLPEDRVVVTPRLQFRTSDSTDAEAGGPLEIQGHYGLLVNLGRQPLEPLTEHARQLVTEAELPLKLPTEMVEQAMEIVRLVPQGLPRWEIKQLETQEAPAATIPLAELTTVLEATGSWRTEVVYQVKNRQRQFLPVQLPEDSRLIAVLVNKRPARAVEADLDGVRCALIPLPPAGVADLAIPVRLVIQGQLPRPLLSAWGLRRVSLPRPQVLTREQSAEWGIPILHTVWKLSTPDEVALRPITGAGTNLQPITPSETARISLQSRFQEIVELSNIISSSSKSLKQRKQAADNYLYLQEQLQQEQKTNGVALPMQPPPGGETSDFDGLLRQLEESSRDQGAADRQSLGRAYILQNNDDILNLNTLHPAKPSTRDGQSPAIVVPSEINEPESRIRLPELKKQDHKGSPQQPSPAAAGKRGAVQEDQRRQLLEENFRQNSLLQQNESQMIDQLQREGGMGGAFGRERFDDRARNAATPSPAQSAAPPRDPANKLFYQSSPQLGGTPLLGSAIAILEEKDQADILGERAGEGWSTAGGLSLDVSLVKYPQELIFSKVGGDPELEIEVHSRTLRSRLLGGVWAVGCAALLFWLLYGVSRWSPRVRWRRGIRLALLLGVLGAILLPMPLAAGGLLLAVAASIVIGLFGYRIPVAQTANTR